MNNLELELLREKQLEILSTINDLCLKNNIKYSLHGGSALGAIRHGGFIPWDDDVDIAMHRNDYIRFKEICKLALPTNYYFQDFHSKPDFHHCFAKVGDLSTTFIEEGSLNRDIHKGIFVDIFPLDIIPSNPIKAKLQYYNASLNILISRDKVYDGGNILMKLISLLFKNFLPKKTKNVLRKSLEKNISKYRNENSGYLGELTATKSALARKYPINLFENVKSIDFSDFNTFIFSDYDEYLNIKFGDYMKLPPINERKLKHSPLKCDTENPYQHHLANMVMERK